MQSPKHRQGSSRLLMAAEKFNAVLAEFLSALTL